MEREAKQQRRSQAPPPQDAPQWNTRTPKKEAPLLPGESVEIDTDTPPPREKLRRGEAAAPAAAAGEGRGCVYNALYSGT